jgi:hypothetical protein
MSQEMNADEAKEAVRNSLRAANERFGAGDPKAHNSVGRALESLVEYHDLRNTAGSPDEFAHRAFLDDVTAGLVRVARPLSSALFRFHSFIECAREDESWRVCQRASAAQFLVDDHAAAIPAAETDPGVRESLDDIAEETLKHIKEYGGIAEVEKRPVGFPASHWWWTGNVAYVEPGWVPPPGWPPVRDWNPIP